MFFWDGHPGEIETIAGSQVEPSDWFVEQFRGGVLVLEARFGRVFLTPQDDAFEELVFVARRAESSAANAEAPAS
ncbi:MAG: hypothetical protein QM757_32185 [Paludibaculum sp.]